jgi:Skp family chaperone for outer membrane proteins
MTGLTKIGFLTIVLAIGPMAAAQDAKIALVDLQGVAFSSEDGKAAAAKLEKRYQEISAIMQAAQKSIQDKETTLKNQERALSEARKNQLLREIESEGVAFNRKNEDYQREMAQLEQDIMGPVMDKARTILAAFLKEANYTILLDYGAEGGNIVWFNGANDVTAELVKRMNAAPPVTTPVPAAETTPATKPAANQ